MSAPPMSEPMKWYFHAERLLTYKLDTIVYEPYGNRIGTIILRTVYYSIATAFRLLYMLVAMYFNTGLFLVLVMALTTGQLVIEYKKSLKASRGSLGELATRSIPLHDDPSQGHGKAYQDNADEEEQQLFAVDNDEFAMKQKKHTARI
ncbi:hypothetical protein BC943DRAFT_338920 [Umbelopsis sp. AD052]|nr:hypothetical protein BC943DRAFT_338920 [Umbelopsis sp. AD052]